MIDSRCASCKSFLDDGWGIIGGVKYCSKCYPRGLKVQDELADRRATIRQYVEEKKR